MKQSTLLIIVAFVAGLAVAALVRPGSPGLAFAPEARAELMEYKPEANGLQYFVTASDDAQTVVLWCFDSAGRNTKEFGPDLRWSKSYKAGTSASAAQSVR